MTLVISIFLEASGKVIQIIQIWTTDLWSFKRWNNRSSSIQIGRVRRVSTLAIDGISDDSQADAGHVRADPGKAGKAGKASKNGALSRIVKVNIT